MSENNYLHKDYIFCGLVFKAISFIIESDGRKSYTLKQPGAGGGTLYKYAHELKDKEHNISFWQDKEDQMAVKDMERKAENESAKRYNSGKPQLSMIDSEILNVLANVLAFGASKYGRSNWQKGLSRDSVMDSMLRHAIALSNGQELDEESGLPHAGHITANLMFHEYYKSKGKYETD